MTSLYPSPHRKLAPFARYGFLLAIACVVAALASGLGYRFGWWGYVGGFTILKWSAYAAGLAVLLSLIGAFSARPGSTRSGFVIALLGIAIGLAVFAGPLLALRTAKSVPPIHDITTDTVNPPPFVAILPLRAHADNGADYGGAEVAAQQQQAYPQIKPLVLAMAPDKATERATDTARALGWEILDSVPAAGRVEATDTTLLYGFKDDIVVRVTPDGQGSRVDVRSASRVGTSDLGVNAKRITTFMTALAAAK